jgi:hypothetical protein
MEFTNVFNQGYMKAALQSNIRPRIKVEILDENESVISEITNEISADSVGRVSINYQQGVRATCSITLIDKDGSFIPKSENQLFWINRKFKIYMGLSTRRNFAQDTFLAHGLTPEQLVLYSELEEDIVLAGSGIVGEIDTYWFSLGVFYVTNPSVTRDFSNQTVTIDGVDKFGIFGSELGYNQLETTYVIPAGTNIYQAIRDILLIDKGNGYVMDPIVPILDPIFSTQILPYDINKSPGSYLGEILIEFGYILGADVYYDVDGRFTLTASTTDLFYDQKASIWEFSDVLPEYSNSRLEFDFVNAINTVKVTADNVNGRIIEYTAENNNPASSTRIELIGRKVAPMINSSYIYSEQQAKEYAEFVLRNRSIVQTMISFNSTLLPHLNVNNVVGITDKYFDYVRQRFIIKTIDIPLDTKSLMSISASNIAELPFAG